MNRYFKFAPLVYLLASSISLADEQASGDLAKQSQNPVGDLISLPFDFKLQAFGYATQPEGGLDWNVQFAVKFLFPK